MGTSTRAGPRRVSTPGGHRGSGRRRWGRVALWIGLGCLILAGLFYGAGGWYFANVLRDRALDSAQRRAALEPTFDLTVVRVADGTVAIRPAAGAEVETLSKEGVWGLQWADGYGQVGRIVSTHGSIVVREYAHMAGTELAAGMAAWLDSRAFPADPRTGLGIEFRDVVVSGELGPLPAWFIQGRRSTWAVLVHGNSLTRRDVLRAIPPISAQGFPILALAYRNAPESALDPSGYLRYGLTEWKDLQAAARYALDRGAERLIMVGYSMGGAIVANFLHRSPLADRVDAAIVDAPMLDFGRTVDLNAARETLPLIGIGVPSSLTASARWFAGWRFGVDWSALNYLRFAPELDVPILLIHGTRDMDVPIQTSRDLAAARPDLVTFVPIDGAAHMESWNVDPERYDRLLVRFLRMHVGI